MSLTYFFSLSTGLDIQIDCLEGKWFCPSIVDSFRYANGYDYEVAHRLILIRQDKPAATNPSPRQCEA